MAETSEQRVVAAVDKSDENETVIVKLHCSDLGKLTSIADFAHRIVKNYKNYQRPLNDAEKDLRCAIDAYFGEPKP